MYDRRMPQPHGATAMVRMMHMMHNDYGKHNEHGNHGDGNGEYDDDGCSDEHAAPVDNDNDNHEGHDDSSRGHFQVTWSFRRQI